MTIPPPDLAQWLLSALWISSSAVGLTVVLRRLPPIEGWVRRGLKPWACNLCCATWSSLAITAALCVATADPWTLAAWLPALALSVAGLHHADPPAPPDFANLALPQLDEPRETAAIETAAIETAATEAADAP
ncbi:MAG TPA: hypothetical protein ENK57_10255 [Polyangiaceae bacterium]|nr:hypothetical protein [Polyangiaceae bacterium]